MIFSSATISICILLLIAADPCGAQTVPYRHYKANEQYHYKLTTQDYRNGRYDGTSVAISAHRVLKTGALFEEEIRWIYKSHWNGRDSISFEEQVKKISPYKISLSRQGALALPPLRTPGMTGEITDLNTFYVAIAPALNAQLLTASNQFLENPGIKEGNFADSVIILFGKDCIKTTQRLIFSGPDSVVIETSFLPPGRICLEPLLDTIAKPCKDGRINNFQMIQKSQQGKVNLFWGVEQFIIRTTLDTKSGRIIRAMMDNQLSLRMRYNSSADLSTYDIEMPVTLHRIVTLDILP